MFDQRLMVIAQKNFELTFVSSFKGTNVSKPSQQNPPHSMTDSLIVWPNLLNLYSYLQWGVHAQRQ